MSVLGSPDSEQRNETQKKVVKVESRGAFVCKSYLVKIVVYIYGVSEFK